MNDLTTTAKSFWQKPEGTTGKVLLAGAVVFGGYYTLKFTANVLELIERCVASGLNIALTGTALAILTSPLWSERARALTELVVGGFLRAITSLIVAIDPIGIRKDFLKKKKKEHKQHKKEVGVVEGVARELREVISSNAEEAQEHAEIARAAHENGSSAAFQVSANQNDRLLKENKKNQDWLALIDASLMHLYQLDEILTVAIADLEYNIISEERSLKTARTVARALGLTQSILQGGIDRDLSIEAAKQIKDEVNAKFGMVAQFRKDHRGMIEQLQLRKGVVDAKMLEQLKLTSQRGQALVTDPAMQKRLLPSSTQGVTDAHFSAAVRPVSNDEVERLFTGRK